MKRIINDWEPEVKSLLDTLKANGLTPLRGDNGEEDFNYYPEKEAEFIDNLTACDEARLYVHDSCKLPYKAYALLLIFGNSPGELVADYNVHPLLDKATDEHYNKWDGRKQPTKEVE